MPNEKTDSKGFSTQNADMERDLGAKGGPATGTGSPTSKHGVGSSYEDDSQTQITAKKKGKTKRSENKKTGKNL